MIAYFDTSALIKLLVVETGTDIASRLWDEADEMACVRVGHVEARAALEAARRNHRLSSDALRAAVSGLEVLWAQMSVVEVDETVMREAGDLAAHHGLRGYDAVHLAAACLVGADVFVCADARLCAAATGAGLHIANPVGPT